MKTPREFREWPLRFLVNFAAMDLERYSPADWRSLRTRLETFLDVPWEPVGIAARGPFEPPLPETYPEAEFRSLQEDLRAVLRNLADPRERVWRPAPSIKIQGPLFLTASGGGAAEAMGVAEKAKWGIRTIRAAKVAPIRMTQVWIGSASVRDAFLLITFLLLNNEMNTRIRACPEPKCRRLFVRVRKQRYCSRRCVNRANQRAWRNGVKGREREAARKRTRYARQRKKALGRKVRVGRKGGTR